MFQALDPMRTSFLRRGDIALPLAQLWERDVPLYVTYVSLHDGNFYTASTHRSMAGRRDKLPGMYFLDPARGWTDDDLHDCVLASCAIPVRTRPVPVRVPWSVQVQCPTGRSVLLPDPPDVRRACVDGGIRSQLPMAEAVMIADTFIRQGHDVEFWAVANTGMDRTVPFEVGDSVAYRLTRFLEIMQEEILCNDISDYLALHWWLNVNHQGLEAPAEMAQAQYSDPTGWPRRLPPLYLIQPDFFGPRPGHEGQTVDDLFADMACFDQALMQERWDYGRARARDCRERWELAVIGEGEVVRR